MEVHHCCASCRSEAPQQLLNERVWIVSDTIYEIKFLKKHGGGNRTNPKRNFFESMEIFGETHEQPSSSAFSLLQKEKEKRNYMDRDTHVTFFSHKKQKFSAAGEITTSVKDVTLLKQTIVKCCKETEDGSDASHEKTETDRCTLFSRPHRHFPWLPLRRSSVTDETTEIIGVVSDSATHSNSNFQMLSSAQFVIPQAEPEYFCPKCCDKMSIPTISVSCDHCRRSNKNCDCENCRSNPIVNDRVDPNLQFWGCRNCDFDTCSECLHK